MNLGFLSPGLLAGMGIAVVPLVVHLLSRRRPRILEFPTIRFLQEVVADQKRFWRVRDLILFLLRTLALLVIASAFLRPILSSFRIAGKDPSAASQNLIVLDDSLSMMDRQTPTVFGEARAGAVRILETLHRGDEANVWFLSRNEPVFPDFSTNIRGLLHILENAEPRPAAPDVPAALSAIREHLERTGKGGANVYILSDFQRSAWARVSRDSLKISGPVTLIPIERASRPNAAILETRISPPRPVAMEPVRLECQVANYGPAERTIPVRMSIRNQPGIRNNLVIPPYSVAHTVFHVGFDSPGIYEGTVTLEEDLLPEDDTRYVVFPIGNRIPVLLLSDADPKDPETGLFFLRRAVAPVEQSGLLLPIPKRADTIAPDDFRNIEVALAADLSLLPDETLGNLLQYMDRGGNLIYFADRPSDADNLRRLENLAEGRRVLPFSIGDYFDLSRSRGRSVPLAEANFDSPLLKLFRDRENGDLSLVRVTGFFTTERDNELAEILMAYEDGTVAMGRQTVGAGSLTVCNFSPRRRNSNLATHSFFPPLLHEFIKGLRGPGFRRDSVPYGRSAGGLLEGLTGADTLTIQVRTPSGAPIASRIEPGPSTVSLLLPPLEELGFYRIMVRGEPSQVLAVNPDPIESDLRPLSSSEIQGLGDAGTTGAGIQVLTGGIELVAVKQGAPLWPYLTLLALGLLLLEQWLLQTWKTA